MDKLQVTLVAVKKYYFWALTGLLLVVALGFWFMVTDNLAAQYDNREKTLKSELSSMKTIAYEANPPNEKVIEAHKKRHGELYDKVFHAWEKLYQQQDAKNPWPSVLGDDTVKKIKALRPDEEIDPTLCAHYQNVIQKHFPTLFQLVDLREKGKGIVDWDPADVARLTKRFMWPVVPSTLEVRLAQEDLWVYEALLRIIKNTNEGYTANYNAPVSRIEALQIGRDVKFSSAEGESAGQQTGGSGQGSSDDSGRSLKSYRYVNEKGVPLGPDDVQPFFEFKMMPVRLKLRMDQSKINKLMAQCANSNMPVEVRRVRLTAIERESAMPTTGGAGESSSTTSATSSGDTPTGRSDTNVKGDARATSDVDIEIQGIIYIYNPPARDKLGTGALGEQLGMAQPETPAPANVSAAAPATPVPGPAGATVPAPAATGGLPAPAVPAAAAPTTPAVAPPRGPK